MADCQDNNSSPDKDPNKNKHKAGAEVPKPPPKLAEGHVLENDGVRVFARYITKNGKRIYPKNGTCFSWVVPLDKYEPRG